MKSNKGFTLIELMIVIAIIAILMSYAIPAYQDYTVRAKAGEGLTLSSSIKSTISESWVSAVDITTLSSGINGIPAANNTTGNNVSQILVTAGVIEVTYNNDDSRLAGETLTLTPLVPGNAKNPGTSLLWECSSSLENKYLPSECRAP